ncbi:MAG: hypothetical protein EOP51_08195 [Sphingobacteriales bacterium]|nr:MAG: hypothetical protein EOP51_08195 [Sphingobacteriales bacterium]
MIIKQHTRSFLLLPAVLLSTLSTLHAQEETQVVDSDKYHKTVVAHEYPHSKTHNFILGKHYRDEWRTPVLVKVLMLDTAYDGLVPYEAGGGRQSKSLKLHDTHKREYVLRSLDKSFGRALPDIFQGTFVEHLVNDQVTIGHPYSAVTIPPMADAARIYHTNPQFAYIPKQLALDTFNENFGNRLYMLEQRPDENWETAENFGNAEKIVGTEKMLENVLKDNHNQIDEALYVRSRLFDMLIGDWGRHDDQWRWAAFEEKNSKYYRPIPRDRDQAYTLFDGALPGLVLHAADLDYLRGFKNNIKAVNIYNYTARHLDRRCASSMTKEQWINIAEDMQSSITDEVIDKAVKQLPPEVYPLSGQAIASKLKSRRDHLVVFATTYYDFLARHVDIEGSQKKEYFEVNRVNDEHTLVQVYDLDKDGQKADTPFYVRMFKTAETRDIRLFGIGGEDVYKINGNVDKGIKLTLVGGEDRDSIIDVSQVHDGGKKTQVYDDRDNYVERSGETKLHYGSDSAIHAYDYAGYEYHKKGLKLGVSYNNPDRVYASIGYHFARHGWRKYPYEFEQALFLRYSLSQNALSLLYQGDFYQAVGKWNLKLNAYQDFVRWTNFFGLGNDTKRPNPDDNYYQLRTNEFLGSVGLNRTIKKHNLDLTISFQAIEIFDDANRFISENYTPNDLFFFEHHTYGTARAGYTYQDVNDPGVPTKGVMFYGGIAWTQNFYEWNKGFATYNGIAQFYLPLYKKFSLSSRIGATSISGTPEFYQYASIGGGQNLRGFDRDRFWGKTALYNTNELRWITDFRSYVMNGKIGFLALVDEGRVWMPGESSNTIHVGYGGGIIIAPFNKFTASVSYAFSNENNRIHLNINKLLF